MTHAGEVESTGRKAFNATMSLAFQEHSTASHVLLDEANKCMVFFWHAPESYEPWKPHALLKPMPAEKAADYAWEWLLSMLKKSWPRAIPGEMHEGGFRIKFGGEFRLHWVKGGMPGPDRGSPYAICAIYPEWHEVHQ